MPEQQRQLNFSNQTLALPPSAFGRDTMESIINSAMTGAPTLHEQVNQQIALNRMQQDPNNAVPDNQQPAQPQFQQQPGSQDVRISPEEYAAFKKMEAMLPAMQTPEFLRAYAISTGIVQPNVPTSPQPANPQPNDANGSQSIDDILAGIMNDNGQPLPSTQPVAQPTTFANNQNVANPIVVEATPLLIQNGLNPVQFDSFVRSLSPQDYVELFKIYSGQQGGGQQPQPQPQPQQPQQPIPPIITIPQPASFSQNNQAIPVPAHQRNGWGV